MNLYSVCMYISPQSTPDGHVLIALLQIVVDNDPPKAVPGILPAISILTRHYKAT